MGKQLSDCVENIVGKGEIAHQNDFKSCLLLMRQNEYLWSKELTEKKDFCIATYVRKF